MSRAPTPPDHQDSKAFAGLTKRREGRGLPVGRIVSAVLFARQRITEKMRTVAIHTETKVAVGDSVAILDLVEASYDGEVIAVDYWRPDGPGTELRRKVRVAIAGRGRERVR